MKDALDVFMVTIRMTSICLAAATVLAACGGSGPGATELPNADAGPQASNDACAEGAIEGGGLHKLSGVVSSVGTDGRVTVSNVRISTAGAQVLVDGASASVSKLRPGDIVALAGAVNLDTRTGCAATVLADAVVTARVDALDLETQSLRVLGQDVRVDAGTVFPADMQDRRLASLQPGDRVRVAGLYADGVIVATRIDRESDLDGYLVSGVVTSLDVLSRTFRIGGIVVRYEDTVLAGFGTGGPRDGDTVRLTGSAFEVVDAPPRGYTAVQPTHVERIQFGAPLTLVPGSASVYPGGSVQLSASSGADTVSWRVLDTQGNACTAGSCGIVDASGRYTAPGVKVTVSSVLVTATSLADPRNTATVTIVITEPPFPVWGQHVLSGEVFAIGTGMVADADVDLWVQLATEGYSYWWANGPVRSDALGLFDAPKLPGTAHVAVHSWKEGFVQPCAVTAHIPDDLSVRVELVSVESLDSFDPPRPQLASEPSLSGSIYETTPTGRQPVAGAMVWLEEPMGIVFATTLSDRGGGYFVCNHDDLPTIAYLTVTRPGFRNRTVGPVNSVQSATLDIELERE